MSLYPAVIELSSLNGTDGFRISGETAADQSGFSVASAGDVNGDGYADLIIGAPKADGIEGVYANSGAAYVVFGGTGVTTANLSLSSLDGTNGFKLAAGSNLNQTGISVAGAGDVNGDGYADVIIGANFANGLNAPQCGASYIVYGHSGPFDSWDYLFESEFPDGGFFRFRGEGAGDQSGFSVAAAGDVNGDGLADVIIGAPRADEDDLDGAGASYVLFGKLGGIDPDLSPQMLDGATGFKISGDDGLGFLGHSVASAGDINGDGFDDLLIGASGSDTDGFITGATYVVFGHAGIFDRNLDLWELDGTTGTTGFRIKGEADYDESGISVAGAGDINADGLADFIIGAHRADPIGEDSGASYVVFGRASGFGSELDLATLDGANGFQIDGEAVGDLSGFAVASAGDVDGDGFDDLIIGSKGADPDGLGDAGASYVVFGRATGFSAALDLSTLDGTNGFRLNGANAGDASGSSVASAGDLNGDGLSDLVIGAPGADPDDQADSGASYVIFGRLPTAAVNRTGTVASQSLVGGNFDDTLSGLAGRDQLFGNAGKDLLNGGLGADTLFAGGGDDTLDGGDGDRLEGGADNDLYRIGASTAAVVEGEDAGLDTVEAARTYTLGQNVEHLTLRGTGAFGGTGNALANTITGNGSANKLDGGDGGIDTLIGGDGEDLYVIGAGDIVQEIATAALQIDTVQSTASYSLGANLENLTLTGTAANGTGNQRANTITGNTAANRLDGGSGGVDTLIGRGGNDTYVVGLGDKVQETATSLYQIDTVESSVSYNLGANLENLRLTGTAANASGNGRANTITGNASANKLDGGPGGIDTLIGGNGNDTYVIGAGDVVKETATSLLQIDTVRSAASYTLGANLENLTLTGSAASGVGNSRANLISGTNLGNTLKGGAGKDTIKGFDGIDTLNGGTGTDQLYGGLNSDTFVFKRGDSGLLPATADTIRDWSAADKLDMFYVGSTANTIEASGASTTIDDAAAFAESRDTDATIYAFVYNENANIGFLVADLNNDNEFETGMVLAGAGSASDFAFGNII